MKFFYFSGPWISKIWKVSWCLAKYSSWFSENIFGPKDKSIGTVETWLRRKGMVKCMWRTNGCCLHTRLRIFPKFYSQNYWFVDFCPRSKITSFLASSRLANILGLSSRDIPLCLREQFGYAKKNSVIFEAQYDTTGNYKYNVVPVSQRANVIPLRNTKLNYVNQITWY